MTRHIENLAYLIAEGAKLDEFTALEYGEKICMAFAKDSNTDELTREFARACLKAPVAWFALRDGFADATFDAVLVTREELAAECVKTSAVFEKFPRHGLLGMTPDHIKDTPEFKAAQLCYKTAFAASRKFNQFFTQTYAKQYRKWRLNKRKAV